MKLAVLIGINKYNNLKDLDACINDVETINNILIDLNKFDDICLLNKSQNANNAKKIIIDFIEKHKENKIDELFFYFSGHGARFNDDFYYAFSSFKKQKKETTALRNSELDGLLRNLKPSLTIKIIDSCYCGSTYIKSVSDIKPIFEKSAEENKFKNLYFMYSSSSTEQSIASNSFSFFTKSFCLSLIENGENVRYRDIMAFLADDMSNNNYPTPTFIVQAQNTELFGLINTKIAKYIKKTFNIIETVTSTNKNLNNTSDISENNNSLLKLIKSKSDIVYCTKKEAFANMNLFKDNLSIDGKDIEKYFICEEHIDESKVSNEIAISKWIESNDTSEFFVKAKYDTVTYNEKEYVKVPKRPVNGLYRSFSISALGYNKDGYELVDVPKRKQVLSSFSYTTETPYKSIVLILKPKFSSLNYYSLVLQLIFSRKDLVIFFFKEKLEYLNWEEHQIPQNEKWSYKILPLKNNKKIIGFAEQIINDLNTYVLEEINKAFSD